VTQDTRIREATSALLAIGLLAVIALFLPVLSPARIESAVAAAMPGGATRPSWALTGEMLAWVAAAVGLIAARSQTRPWMIVGVGAAVSLALLLIQSALMAAGLWIHCALAALSCAGLSALAGLDCAMASRSRAGQGEHLETLEDIIAAAPQREAAAPRSAGAAATAAASTPGPAARPAAEATLTLPDGGRTTAGGTLILQAAKIPHKLGRYHIERQLGRGSMGAVYLGQDPRIGRRVAIKTLALAREVEPEDLASVRERFFSEAATAGRLNHSGIVQVFDAGEDDDLCWIAMEFVDGEDLSRHVSAETLLPVNDLIGYIADAADALEAAHQGGVIHRDIKPGNLMVTRDGALKIMDFGVARVSDVARTRTGMILGTPSYMSPEQISGRRLDPRTDVYSLGVTLYHLLTAQLPFRADSLATLMHHITHQEAALPSSLRPGLSAGVDALVERAMRKNPEFRYRCAADFASALRAAVPGRRERA